MPIACMQLRLRHIVNEAMRYNILLAPFNHVQKCNVLNCHTRDGGYTEERGNV